MPPRRDTPTVEESLATVAEQLATLIAATNNASSRTDVLTAAISKQSDTLSERIAKLSETTANLVTGIVKITDQHPIGNDVSSTSTAAPGSSASQPPPNQPPPPPPPPHGLNIRPPKISLATFDGSNPLDWLFQADQYFTFYNIEPPRRLAMIAFHLSGEALSWYKYLFNNRLLTTWEAFTRALETRFGPSTYDNHQAMLFKLRQTTTVSNYQAAFEKLSNCVVGLTPVALLNCFLSGLRIDIQQELSILRPQTINQATGLAKLIEDKLNDQKSHIFSTSINGHSDTHKTLATPVQTSPMLPIKKLTPDEMHKRRVDGLCYNCPEKYHPGHRCKPPQFLLLQSEHEPPWTCVMPDNLGLEDKAGF